MKNVSKQQMRLHLAKIMKLAEENSDLSETQYQMQVWDTVIQEAFTALGAPSLSEIDAILGNDQQKAKGDA